MIRVANNKDIKAIMNIIYEAKRRMKEQGLTQWQNDYPNDEIIKKDIESKSLFVYEENHELLATMSVFMFDPVYDSIEGQWLNDNPYAVIHRIAIGNKAQKRKLTNSLYDFVFTYFNVHDIRIDTHKNNEAMIRSLKRNGFIEVGVVHVTTDKDSHRLAYHLHRKEEKHD